MSEAEAAKKRIKPYVVLCESDLSRLEEQVGRLIVKGYRPHGSLVIQEEHGDWYFYQPMLIAPRPVAAKPKA